MAQHVITIMLGANPDTEAAEWLAQELTVQGLVQEFRPGDVMGGGIEVIPAPGVDREAIEKRFTDLKYEVVD